MPSVARHLRKLCILGLLASPAHAADDWQAVSFISETVGNHSNRLCMGVPDHMRGSDIGCPTYAPSLTTGGHVSITGNVSANRFIGDGSGLTNLNVQGDRIVSGTHGAIINEGTGTISLTTGGVPWGYFSAGWSRLANLFADTVSSTVVSATNVSATYVDAARGGTVSGTYGYFRHISSTYLSGDGSGLYNVPASAVSGLNLDRITSGSHAVIANQGTGYVSLTTGGTTWGYLSAGWSRLANLFADTVSSTLVSATNVSATYVDATRGGTVSGTYGYFHHISGTYVSGDGSGLYNVPASAVSGLNLDRITSGSHAVIANQNTGYVSLTTGGSTWGYLSAGWSRLANLFADTVSSTLVSATNVSATSVDTTRGGTVSGTYGYFRFISGTDIHGRFSGDGSGLTGVTAAASDRIVSGSTGGTRMVAISNTGYISITQAGANSGWFDPTRGLVTLGVSATGAISATRGYFSGNVGIGAFPNNNALYIYGNVARIAADDYAQWSASSNGVNVFYGANGNTGRAYLGTTSNHGLRIYANNQTRMSIAANGNVGISTTDPLAKLDVVGTISASDAIQVGNSGLACSPGIAGALRYSGSKIEFCNGVAWGALVGAADAMGDRIVSGSTNIIAHQDRSLTFTTAGTQRMVVGEDGRVGIGMTTPAASLQVSGTFIVSTSTQLTTPSLYVGADGRVGIGGMPNAARMATFGDFLNGDMTLLADLRPSFRADATGTYHYIGSAIQPSIDFADGTTNSGYVQAQTISTFRRNIGGDAGTLASLIGQRMVYGHYLANASTRHTNLVKGIELGGYAQNGTIGQMMALHIRPVVGANVGKSWGIYQEGDSEHNHFAGRIGVGAGRTEPSAALDVAGTISASGAIQVGTSALTCGAGIPGAIRYQGTTLQYCNGTAWTTLGSAGAATAASSTGAVQFNASGVLGGDTNNFFWDNANKRLGIGGGLPLSGTLHLRGQAGTHALYIESGSGSYLSAPMFAIDSAAVTDTSAAWGLSMVNTNTTNSNRLRLGFYTHDLGGNMAIGSEIQTVFRNRTVNGFEADMLFMTRNTNSTNAEMMRITSAGNVGVGTPSPTATLQVSGTFIVSTSVQNLSPSLYVGTNGRIGVRTTSPSAWLHLAAPQAGVVPQLMFTREGRLRSFMMRYSNNPIGKDVLLMGPAHAPFIVFDEDNKVGIGTTGPIANLDVSGTISATNAIQVGTSSLTCGAGIPGAIRYQGTSLQYCNGTSWTTIGGGGGGGQEDRIVSGTHAVTVNEDSGLVSLSTAGTTWGYLNSIRSYLPALTSSQVSSTNVSATLLQIGTGNGAACDGSRQGAMRYSTISSTMEYCQGTAWVSMGPSATAVPSFRAFLSAAQSIPQNTDTKVNLDTIDFDTYNNFDTGNGSFTPTVPGTYVLTANAAYSSLSANQYAYLFIRKNGSVVSQIHFRAGSSNDHAGRAITAIVQANGTTDSFDIAVRHTASSAASLYSNHHFTSFSGALISMAGGGGAGGGGPTALGDLTNVNTAGATPGSIIRYDGSNWVVSDTSSALGDSITSGTHAVAVNETSGYVSLSTAGTTWGYLTSTRSYLPALSSVQVSSTNVSATLLQVGTGNGATCSASTKGAIRYSDTSSTVEYCQGTAWVSMGPSATDAIGFRAQNISTQTVAASTFEKMLLGNEIFDTNGNFASGRFTATVPGTYYFSGIVACKTTTGGCHGQLYVNGSAVLTGSFSSSENDNNSTVSGLLRLNSGDYVELWGRNSGATTMSTGTYLQGFLVGPQSGDGGGGPTALGDLTNVNTAGATPGSVIRYDGSNWVVSDTGSALGDRITSGTHAVTLNTSSGYVSLSTNDTTWGYLNSGNSYLPTLVANKVSATHVSATYLQLSSPTTVLACNSGLTGSMRYTSGTMQVCNGTSWGNIGIGVPAGTISAFAAETCPSGWVEYGPARGRFLRGIDNGAGNDPAGTRAPGNVQADLVGSHTHMYYGSTSFGGTGGGFGLKNSAGGGMGSGYNDGSAFGMNTTSAGGAETRPKNVAVIFCSYAGYESELAPGITTLGGLSDVAVGGATTGQVLTYSGGTWIASTTTGGGADNLGNHTATQSLAMGGYSINNVNQVIGGFGAVATTGTLDWNDVSNARSGSGYSLLQGSASNGPGGNHYYHPFSFEYATKDGTGNMTQFAIGYTSTGFTNGAMFLRSRYQGTWSGWHRFVVADTSGNAVVANNMTAAAFLYSSDARLKQNVKAMTGGLAKVDALNPVTFHYTADARKRDRLGFLAQDVEKVFPQAVVTGEDGMKSVDYPSLVPALVGALKELKAEMAADAAGHAQRIRELEAANDNLKAANADILRRLERLESRKAATE